MGLFTQAAFWDWLYSLGEQPLGEALYAQLKQAGQYRVQTLHGQSDDQTWTSDLETVVLDWPVSTGFRFRTLLDLGRDQWFEEFLYLQRDGRDFSVAWFDSHQHERLFRVDEFQRLMQHIDAQQPQVQADTSWLYLGRYVALLSEADARWLTAELARRYQRLCGLEQAPVFEIREAQPYGLRIGDEWELRLKTVSTPSARLRFSINEGARWLRDAAGHWTLQGFAAHSTRVPTDEAAWPVDIHDPEHDRCQSSFPNPAWDALMAALAPQAGGEPDAG